MPWNNGKTGLEVQSGNNDPSVCLICMQYGLDQIEPGQFFGHRVMLIRPCLSEMPVVLQIVLLKILSMLLQTYRSFQECEVVLSHLHNSKDKAAGYYQLQCPFCLQNVFGKLRSMLAQIQCHKRCQVSSLCFQPFAIYFYV